MSDINTLLLYAIAANTVIANLEKENAELKPRLEEANRLLKKLEFSSKHPQSGYPVCCICGEYEYDGHIYTCDLKAYFNRLADASKPEESYIKQLEDRIRFYESEFGLYPTVEEASKTFLVNSDNSPDCVNPTRFKIRHKPKETI